VDVLATFLRFCKNYLVGGGGGGAVGGDSVFLPHVCVTSNSPFIWLLIKAHLLLYE